MNMFIHSFPFVQILMSVVIEHTIALKYALTLMEALRVDVMMVIY